MGTYLLVLPMIGFNILTVLSKSEEPWQCREEFCYSLITQYGGISFSRAEEKCMEHNSSLASIHSEEERQYVESIRKTSVGMPVWLGMRRSENGRTWVDRSAVNYLPPPWDYHSAKNQETCIYTSGDWYEGTCSNNLYFVCKRKAEKKPSSYSMLSKSTSEFWTTEMRWTPLIHISTQENVMEKDEVESVASTTALSEDLSITEKLKHSEDHERPYDEQEFREMLKSLKVKKKKVSTKEAPGSQAIGVVAILILLIMFTGVILLDLNTFRQNWKMFRRNMSYVRRK